MYGQSTGTVTSRGGGIVGVWPVHQYSHLRGVGGEGGIVGVWPVHRYSHLRGGLLVLYGQSTGTVTSGGDCWCCMASPLVQSPQGGIVGVVWPVYWYSHLRGGLLVYGQSTGTVTSGGIVGVVWPVHWYCHLRAIKRLKRTRVKDI